MTFESDMTGRTCMITGATSGIGQAAALDLARLGASLVLVGRNAERGERVLKEVRRVSRVGDVTLLLADLSSQSEIRRLAADFLATANSLLDVLPESVQLLTAHRFTPPGAPILRYEDLQNLQTALLAIRSGELQATGTYPRVYRVNDDLEVHADFRWGQRW